jgi:hypothetical protein
MGPRAYECPTFCRYAHTAYSISQSTLDTPEAGSPLINVTGTISITSRNCEGFELRGTSSRERRGDPFQIIVNSQVLHKTRYSIENDNAALPPKRPTLTPTPATTFTSKIILLSICTAAPVVLALHFGTSRSYRRRYYQERTRMCGGEDP